MTEAERNTVERRALLLYDGVCALCNGVVQFLMNRDRLDRFRYAPLQSSLGREVLARYTAEDYQRILRRALDDTKARLREAWRAHARRGLVSA